MVKRRKATAAFNRMKVSVSLPSQTKNGRPGQRRRRRRRRKNSNIKQTEWTEDLREWNIYQTIIMTIIKGKNEKKNNIKIKYQKKEKRREKIEFQSFYQRKAAALLLWTTSRPLLLCLFPPPPPPPRPAGFRDVWHSTCCFYCPVSSFSFSSPPLLPCLHSLPPSIPDISFFSGTISALFSDGDTRVSAPRQYQ